MPVQSISVEEKFWSDFIATFNVPLALEKRFNTDPSSFRIVADTFAKLTAGEIEAKASDKELCLSIVRKI